MMKFNALQFVNSLSCDLTGEFDDLEKLLQENEQDTEAIRRTCCHLNSLIQGFEYMVEFIEGDEDREELTKIIKQKREELYGYYPRAASAVFSAKLGKPVTVVQIVRAEGGEEFEAHVDGHLKMTFNSRAKVKNYIDTLAEGEA